jgi:hypothetical protein
VTISSRQHVARENHPLAQIPDPQPEVSMTRSASPTRARALFRRPDERWSGANACTRRVSLKRRTSTSAPEKSSRILIPRARAAWKTWGNCWTKLRSRMSIPSTTSPRSSVLRRVSSSICGSSAVGRLSTQ